MSCVTWLPKSTMRMVSDGWRVIGEPGGRVRASPRARAHPCPSGDMDPRRVGRAVVDSRRVERLEGRRGGRRIELEVAGRELLRLHPLDEDRIAGAPADQRILSA